MSTNQDNNHHHKQMLTNRSSLLLVMFLFTIMMTNSVINCNMQYLRGVGDNLLVTKNNKIVQLAYNTALVNDQQLQQQQQQQSIIRISNNQQTFTIQLLSSSQNSNSNTFLQAHMQILSALVFNKGYIRPLQQQPVPSTIKSSSTPQHKQQNQHMIKGYRYFKQSSTSSSISSSSTKHEQINNEINNLLRLLIKQNSLGYLSMRLQDTFEILFGINGNDAINDGKGVANNNNTTSNTSTTTRTQLISIDISYLFPTIQQSAIPQHILSTLQIKTQQQQQQRSQQNIITLQRRLSGKGLHQSINFTLTLNDKTDIQLQSIINQKQQCMFMFTDILPQSTYIDVDQNRQSIRNYQVINIQKPAFDSKQYYYQYSILFNKQFKQIGVNKYQYQQTIHFRYPQPSLLNYTKVYLHPIQQAKIVCYNKNIYSNEQQQLAPTTTIYEVQENVLFDRGTAKIPNADISKQKIVSIVTLAVCLVTVLMIVSRLKKF